MSWKVSHNHTARLKEMYPSYCLAISERLNGRCWDFEMHDGPCTFTLMQGGGYVQEGAPYKVSSLEQIHAE